MLTHGAGGHCGMPLLVALAGAFAEGGVTVLRCDLPYRQKRAGGPPSPQGAGRDREGLRHAVHALRATCGGRVFVGGQSYGGRMASMLVAEEPAPAQALLLLSYPLHPPGKPDDLRIEHLPRIRVPAMFVHGDADPFGTPGELARARALIPARTELVTVRGGHDLGWGRRRGDAELPPRVVATFRALVGGG
ncbi:MAG: alpha/beta hydrolase family protein [Candidatus Rokuibacteriota bacterium]